jgi:hypothetical protein
MTVSQKQTNNGIDIGAILKRTSPIIYFNFLPSPDDKGVVGLRVVKELCSSWCTSIWCRNYVVAVVEV